MLGNRRSMFKAGAVAATLAFPTLQMITRAAFAAAPPRPEITNGSFHRFMLGKFEITIILGQTGIRVFIQPSELIGVPGRSSL